MSPLWGKTKPEPALQIDWDACPDCECDDFTVGGMTLRGFPVVTCLGCGVRLYGTARGTWRKPHEAAMPPAWAMQDIQARAAKAQADALAGRRQPPQDGKAAPQRGPLAGFRTPPVPEPS